jgi:hypothetical protein
MNTAYSRRLASIVVLLALTAPAEAFQQGDSPSPTASPAAPSAPAGDIHAGVAPSGDRRERSAFHLDLEADPTAFVLRGYSLHAGLGVRHFRLDLGGYAMDVPAFADSNRGFDASFRGAGAKLQLFLFGEEEGGFVGIDGSVNELHVETQGTRHSQSQLQVDAGVNFGWRFALPFGFYVTPWLGISHSLNARDLTVDGNSYHPSAFTFFPAIHLGYRFL